MKSDVLSKLKIGVLMGGYSSERAISLKSGRAVADALQGVGRDVVSLDIRRDDLSVMRKQIQSSRIDVAFIVLHGALGEDGVIQSLLEDLKIPYTGSGVAAHQKAIDKIKTQSLLRENDVPVAPFISLFKGETVDEEQLALHLGAFPVVVKPACEGSSIGVKLVADMKELNHYLVTEGQYYERLLVEQYVRGRELTVGILDDQALPVIEIRPKHGRFFDFESKYTQGKTDYIVPADISEDMRGQLQETAVKVHRIIGCRDYSRIDFMANAQGEIVVLEINTIPGMTPTSLLPKAAANVGISFESLCQNILIRAYGAKKEKNTQSPVR